MSAAKTAEDLCKAKDMLFEYVKDSNSSFYWYHNPNRINHWNNSNEPVRTISENVVIHKHLYGFFKSILDEVRLKEANFFSFFALKISDNGSLSYFRVAASKREYGADIDFNKQRDHAVHTLYNYILGWYLFDNSDNLREAFTEIFSKRMFKPTNDPSVYDLTVNDGELYGNITKEKKFLANEFGDIWSITSLLHDIGYILEGSIPSISIEVENVRVSRGSKIIHDYFNHRFWNACPIDFRAVQSIAKVLDVSIPDFRSAKSLASLSDHLCDVGACENIRRNLVETNGFRSFDDEKKERYGLNREAFSLWMTYYEVYRADHDSKSIMEKILDIVKKQYYDAMWQGSNQGYRNLNHGVCSGLIVLKALSFFYDFIYGFKRLDTWHKYSKKYYALNKQGQLNEVDKVSNQSYEAIKSFITEESLPELIKNRGERNADYWFIKVLWATASVAIHDVIQEEYYEKICKEKNSNMSLKIILKEEPLAYLGVLVDALQEWDRYSVSGESAFSGGKELLQSNEVYIEKNKTTFYYPKRNGEDLDETIGKKLGHCLDKWGEVVKLFGILPDCQFKRDRDYKENLPALGGSKVYGVANGLPNGLKLVNGVVSGKPEVLGEFKVDVEVKDSQDKRVDQRSYMIIIN